MQSDDTVDSRIALATDPGVGKTMQIDMPVAWKPTGVMNDQREWIAMELALAHTEKWLAVDISERLVGLSTATKTLAQCSDWRAVLLVI
jgi:hypothetical protein